MNRFKTVHSRYIRKGFQKELVPFDLKSHYLKSHYLSSSDLLFTTDRATIDALLIERLYRFSKRRPPPKKM